jgi:hypothetical protein
MRLICCCIGLALAAASSASRDIIPLEYAEALKGICSISNIHFVALTSF